MKYFIVKDGTRQGPYTVEELAMQRLSPDTLVWTRGMPDWAEAQTVPELSGAIDHDVPDVPGADTPQAPIGEMAPPPLPGDDEMQPQEQYGGMQPEPTTPVNGNYMQAAEPKKKSSRGWIVALVALVVLAVLVISKPSRSSHLDAIDRACYDYLSESVDSSIVGGIPVMSDGVKNLAGSFIGEVVEQHFELHDRLLWNVGKFTYGGKEKTVSVGILGHVFTFDKDDVAQAVRKYAEEHRSTTATDAAVQAMKGAVDAARQAVDAVVSRVDSSQVTQKLDSAANQAVDKVASKAADEAKQAAEGFVDKIIDEIENLLGNGNDK
jgi:hypothetical protein